jgi:hypothetical protein
MKFMTMLTVPAFLLVLCALPLRSIGKPSPDDNMARLGLMADSSIPSRLGSVSFNISCKPKVKAEFNRGIALLHSFWLDEAGKSFGNVAARIQTAGWRTGGWRWPISTRSTVGQPIPV